MNIITIIVLSIIIICILYTRHRARCRKRKASCEFAAAYDAYKRAQHDPHALDITGLESGLNRCLQNLKSVKP